jgi:hypothetical protein
MSATRSNAAHAMGDAITFGRIDGDVLAQRVARRAELIEVGAGLA